MESVPETWKPPMPTISPALRNAVVRSSARGNWFDCTPTSMTMPPPASRIERAIFSGRMRWFVSSIATTSSATSGPSTCRSAQSTASP